MYRFYDEKEKRILSAFGITALPIRLHYYGEAMLNINRMLLTLSNYYGIHTTMRISDYYSEKSEEILCELDIIYSSKREPCTIDLSTLSILTRDFEAITAL